MGELLVRSFAYPLEVRDVAGSPDRLTVYGRVVPYGEVVLHDNHVPGGKMFRERFVLGALADVDRYVHRVKLGFEHESGYVSNVGRGLTVEERADGGYMTFKLYRQDAEKAVDHLETTHRGLSLEFYNLHKRTASDGVTERLRVQLVRVAALEDPAYRGAMVLGVRNRTQEGASPDEGAQDQDAGNSPQEGAQPPARPNLDQALAIRDAMIRDNPMGERAVSE